MGLTETSKFISLILRHHPEVIGIALDEHGWADVDELIAGIAKSRPFDMNMVEEIVSTDKKQRYSFSDDKTLIRANQGNSVPVDVELEAKTPPETLWHGTGAKSVPSIDEQGLKRMSRLYVHLSGDYDTAVTVGRPISSTMVPMYESNWVPRDASPACRPSGSCAYTPLRFLPIWVNSSPIRA